MRMLKWLALAWLGLALTWALPAAPQVVLPPNGPPMSIACAYNSALPTLASGNVGWAQCDSQGKLYVDASVSASISGFAPASVGTPISVTTSGVTGTLPAGAVVVASNAGATNTAYCALGASSTTAQQPIPPGGWFAFTVGAATQLTCITSTSTTTVNMVGGSGLPTGSGGGGGGGGGSGGAVTMASGAVASGAYSAGSLASGAAVDGWNITEGTKADLAWTSGSGSIVAILKTISGNTGAAIPAGSNTIGAVTQASGPWTSNITQWATTSLGAPSNYGTSPGAVAVPGVNAFVTNTVAANTAQVNGVTTLTGAGATGTGSQRVTAAQDTTTIAGSAPGTAGTASANVVSVQGIASMTPVQVSQATAGNLNATVVGTGTFAVQAAATLNATPSLANGNGVVPTQGGAVLSATNGGYTNLLQGNAVLATGNPLFAQLTAGSANAGGFEVFDAAGTNKLNVVAASTAPVTATNTAVVVDLRPDSPGIITLGPAATTSSLPVAFSSQYPVNATTTAPIPETISATGTTTAFTATLAAASGKTTYICGFEVDAYATSATTVALTLTGTITGTMNFQEPVGVIGSSNGIAHRDFNPCIPASTTNTTIVVNAGAAGSGGVASISAWGYQL
jgi:hypothetical protein